VDHLNRLGREGTAWVLQECGWPKVARDTRRLYEALSKRLSFPARVRASAAVSE
jgi:hypothetical protein